MDSTIGPIRSPIPSFPRAAIFAHHTDAVDEGGERVALRAILRLLEDPASQFYVLVEQVLKRLPGKAAYLAQCADAARQEKSMM